MCRDLTGEWSAIVHACVTKSATYCIKVCCPIHGWIWVARLQWAGSATSFARWIVPWLAECLNAGCDSVAL
jgi:hypothetical protein